MMGESGGGSREERRRGEREVNRRDLSGEGGSDQAPHGRSRQEQHEAYEDDVDFLRLARCATATTGTGSIEEMLQLVRNVGLETLELEAKQAVEAFLQAAEDRRAS